MWRLSGALLITCAYVDMWVGYPIKGSSTGVPLHRQPTNRQHIRNAEGDAFPPGPGYVGGGYVSKIHRGQKPALEVRFDRFGLVLAGWRVVIWGRYRWLGCWRVFDRHIFYEGKMVGRRVGRLNFGGIFVTQTFEEKKVGEN